jgi:hypothetical protein
MSYFWSFIAVTLLASSGFSAEADKTSKSFQPIRLVSSGPVPAEDAATIVSRHAHVVSREESVGMDSADAHESCSICLMPMENDSEDPIVALSCKHKYHTSCLVQATAHATRCSVCQKAFAQQKGNLPPGSMTIIRHDLSLPGYPGTGTFLMDFVFSGSRVVAPTIVFPYLPERKVGFLPDTPEARRLLGGFIVAFQIGSLFGFSEESQTRGRAPAGFKYIVFGSIHLKSNPKPTGLHGYPDANYFGDLRDGFQKLGIFVDEPGELNRILSAMPVPDLVPSSRAGSLAEYLRLNGLVFE